MIVVKLLWSARSVEVVKLERYTKIHYCYCYYYHYYYYYIPCTNPQWEEELGCVRTRHGNDIRNINIYYLYWIILKINELGVIRITSVLPFLRVPLFVCWHIFQINDSIISTFIRLVTTEFDSIVKRITLSPWSMEEQDHFENGSEMGYPTVCLYFTHLLTFLSFEMCFIIF